VAGSATTWISRMSRMSSRPDAGWRTPTTHASTHATSGRWRGAAKPREGRGVRAHDTRGSWPHWLITHLATAHDAQVIADA